MNFKNSEKGITLISLVVTIVILLIISGVTINVGTKTIKQTKLESLKTNMLLIEAKAKEYVENANFKLGIKEEEKASKIEKIKEEKVLVGDELATVPNYITKGEGEAYVYYYELTTAHLEEMGISNVESNEDNGKYVIKYDVQNAQVEVYYSEGYNGKYSLTEIEEAEVE